MKKIFEAVIFLSLLCACAKKVDEVSVTDTEETILVVNGNEGNFSVLKNGVHQNAEMVNSVQMQAESAQDFCEMPNSLTFKNDYLYLVCSKSQSISVYHKKNLRFIKSLYLGNGLVLQNVVFFGDKAYATANAAHQLTVFLPDSADPKNPVIKRIDLKPAVARSGNHDLSLPFPQGLAVVQDKIFVALTNLNREHRAEANGIVAVIDTNSDEIIDTIVSEGKNTVNVYYDQQDPDLVYFINAGTYQGDGSVDVYSISQGKIIKNILVGGAPFKIMRHQNTAYLTNGLGAKILRFDFTTLTPMSPIDLSNDKCPNPNSKFSFLSDLGLKNNFIFALEFNSRCLIKYNLTNERVEQKFQTGEGPNALFVF